MFRWLLDRVRTRRQRVPGMVARSHLPYYRHDFEAPRAILEALRHEDSTADLLYLGWGKWMLVSVRPHREMIAAGHRGLEGARRLLNRWSNEHTFRANPGAFRRLYQRYLYWLAVSQGARPICEYDHRFVRRYGLEAIVTDFRRMNWMHRTATEHAVFDDNNAQFGLDYEKARARQEADADLRSEYRAIHAWRYVTQLTHGVTRHDDPEKRRHRSGFTTVATIGADGHLTRTG